MSDWWLGQLARQDQYGDTPPANWPVPQMPEQDAFEAAAARVRAPYRNTAPVGSNRIGQLAEQITSMPSWADVATQQMNKDKEAFQTGGIGSLLADTSVAQELAGGFGGTTKAVGKPVMGALAEVAPPFYSAAGRAVENAKLGKGTGEQWLGYLRNQPGVKPEELNYVFGNLPREGTLTKAQMQAHAAENAVTLGEVNKGGRFEGSAKDYYESNMDAARDPSWAQLTQRERAHWENMKNDSFVDPTKYSQWQLPGGENYRETLLTLPEKRTRLDDINQRLDEISQMRASHHAEHPELRSEFDALMAERGPLMQSSQQPFRSSHWDEPNVLAHVRTNDREIPGVGKSLHVEEIQSDWHQKGRQEGYRLSSEQTTPMDAEYRALVHKNADARAAGQEPLAADMARAKELEDALMRADNSKIPDAPFKSTWADVALKRQIREASEKGYDAISWTPGEAQAARYDLSKHVDVLRYDRAKDGNFRVYAEKGDDTVFAKESMTAAELENTFGKDIAKKIQDNAVPNRLRAMEGLDLKVGGEGMKAFYDKMLVDKANAIGKKHGARVEQSSIEKELTVPEARRQGVPITTDKALVGKQPVHVLRITPELRAAAMKGFPLFTAGGVVAGGAMGELARQDKYGRNE